MLESTTDRIVAVAKTGRKVEHVKDCLEAAMPKAVAEQGPWAPACNALDEAFTRLQDLLGILVDQLDAEELAERV